MRIATWNVNGLRARLDFVLHWLRARQPDLVALQELKLSDEIFPHAELEAAGYRAVPFGQKSWNGVAVLGRLDAKPLEVVQRGLPGQDDFGARLLTVRVEAAPQPILFASLYCPNGKHVAHPDFPLKLTWLDALAAHLAERHDPASALVLGGDFNVCPAAIDSWNEAALRGQIFHTDAERERIARLRAWGLRDLFRERHPDVQAFSWWDYRGGAFHRRQGLRIDFLLATPPLLARVREVEIDRDWRKKVEGLIPSDHAPVWADLD
jgi:exodeoxyribonuclease-3